MCYGSIDPPRRSSGGLLPDIAHVAPCFTPPFGEGSRCTPDNLTPMCHLLNDVMRRTLLPRTGYKEGLTNLQQWLIAALVSQTQFDIVDLLISEMEDVIAKGIKNRRQLPYAHWISFLLAMSCHRAHGGELARSPT